jgi:hypothetical protein
LLGSGMARTATASFDGGDWEKFVAVAGVLAAFKVLPKKFSLPIAVVALILALRD